MNKKIILLVVFIIILVIGTIFATNYITLYNLNLEEIARTENGIILRHKTCYTWFNYYIEYETEIEDF